MIVFFFRKEVEGHIFRGYGILGKNQEYKRSVTFFNRKKPLHLIFGEPVRNWSKLAKDLFVLPHAAASFHR